MMFHTIDFVLGFLPICLMGFFILGRYCSARAPLCWLMTCGLFFYGWWSPQHVAVLIGSIVFNYLIARGLRYGTRPAIWLAAGIAVNLAVLGWFKYADFLLHAAIPDAAPLRIILPLAISFFTFQQIMFLVDLRRSGCGAVPAALPPFLHYATFVTLFPHLVAGPIVRAAEVIPQLCAADLVRPKIENLSGGLLIFLLGLGKKLVFADMFGGFADIGFDAVAQGAALSFFEAWYAALAYALQIYFDFSGYSDMAIGLARMLNIRFPLNFDSPYQATDIAAFWRRWHITLGGFLRDYLYIPLGGNRVGPLRQAANLMTTMLLAGLWHGAAWNFVVWGGLHGVFLVVHAQCRGCFRRVPNIASHAFTLFIIIVAWVPFRAPSLPSAWSMLRGMAGLNGVTLPKLVILSFPPLAAVADPVAVMPFLGDARTLSFPEISACLLLGWLIVLMLPNVHRMTDGMRHWALTASFALSAQALLFAPHVAPFLYFQF